MARAFPIGCAKCGADIESPEDWNVEHDICAECARIKDPTTPYRGGGETAETNVPLPELVPDD